MKDLPKLVASLNAKDTKRLISLLSLQAEFNFQIAREECLMEEARVWDDISLTLHVAAEEVQSLLD